MMINGLETLKHFKTEEKQCFFQRNLCKQIVKPKKAQKKVEKIDNL